MIAVKDVRRQIGGSLGADRTTLRYLVDGEELHHSKRAYMDHDIFMMVQASTLQMGQRPMHHASACATTVAMAAQDLLWTAQLI